jgi:hypothetical protein
VLAYPVVAITVAGGVPGWEGDNVYYVRSLWWMKRALVDLRISPFVDPTSYYPVGHAIARSEMTVANTILALPLTVLVGPTRAYDAVLLFSFVATAMGTYLWVAHLTGRRSAGILAGTIVGFLPFRFAHLPGHLPQMTMQWTPLALYAFERFLERRTPWRAAGLGAAVALVALGCWYYGYALGLLLPIYVIARTWSHWTLWRERAWWAGIAVSVAVALALMLPFLMQTLALADRGALDRSIGEMQSWALNVYDVFLPNLAHPLLWEPLGRWFPHHRTLWVEKVHALGYTALVAAVVGLVRWRRRQPRVVVALACVWLASYSIALGPLLTFGDRIVHVPVPRSVAEAAAKLMTQTERTRAARESLLTDGLPIPLPSYLLYRYVPFTKSMRVMSRFTVWTALATAALAGFGMISLVSAGERRFGRAARVWIPATLIVLVAAESATRIPTMMVGPRAVDLWLAAQPDAVVIVELPVDQGMRSFQNYWATENRKRNVFGWSGDSFPPPIANERRAKLESFPSASSLEFLRSVGTTYVLMTPSQIPNWDTMERLVSAEPALQYVQTFHDVRVYRVVK